MFPIVVQSAWACLGVLGCAWVCLGVLGCAWAGLGGLGRAWAGLGVILCIYVLYVWVPAFLVTFEAIFCSNNICFLEKE